MVLRIGPVDKFSLYLDLFNHWFCVFGGVHKAVLDLCYPNSSRLVQNRTPVLDRKTRLGKGSIWISKSKNKSSVLTFHDSSFIQSHKYSEHIGVEYQCPGIRSFNPFFCRPEVKQIIGGPFLVVHAIFSQFHRFNSLPASARCLCGPASCTSRPVGCKFLIVFLTRKHWTNNVQTTWIEASISSDVFLNKPEDKEAFCK